MTTVAPPACNPPLSQTVTGGAGYSSEVKVCLLFCRHQEAGGGWERRKGCGQNGRVLKEDSTSSFWPVGVRRENWADSQSPFEPRSTHPSSSSPNTLLPSLFSFELLTLSPSLSLSLSPLLSPSPRRLSDVYTRCLPVSRPPASLSASCLFKAKKKNKETSRKKQVAASCCMQFSLPALKYRSIKVRGKRKMRGMKNNNNPLVFRFFFSHEEEV